MCKILLGLHLKRDRKFKKHAIFVNAFIKQNQNFAEKKK